MTNSQFPVLIGDLGGTNARFQIVHAGSAGIEEFKPVKTASFASVEDAIKSSVLENTATEPCSVILAAAGPITGGGLDLTNCDWNIHAQNFLKHGPFAQLTLLNDFEAQALALPELEADDVCWIGPQGETSRLATKAVVGPGTGLGVGQLIHANGKWVPVPGEGGHIDLGPRSSREVEVWENLELAGGRVSGEQVLSGAGLLNAYQAICATDGSPAVLDSAEAISDAALNKTDKSAQEALALFCRCLGRFAGDLALICIPKGGVYIAGGIASAILPFLQQSTFRAAFEDKAPHNALLAQIPTGVITRPIPALLGLAALAIHPDQYEIELSNRQWFRGNG